MASLVQKLAPAFSCTAVVNGQFKNISLQDYAKKWLVLFFYPLDFTFVCPTEIVAFSDAADKFKKLNCEVVAASCDSEVRYIPSVPYSLLHS
jgi:peroxiredoxin (alkyl hydroperoxide reductase subunit C)